MESITCLFLTDAGWGDPVSGEEMCYRLDHQIVYGIDDQERTLFHGFWFAFAKTSRTKPD